LSSLGDVLFLNYEVSTHNTSTTYYSRVLSYYRVEVTALAFLRKGNTSGIGVNNTSIKLKVVVSYKMFALLS
jgi:hypothetical protein